MMRFSFMFTELRMDIEECIMMSFYNGSVYATVISVSAARETPHSGSKVQTQLPDDGVLRFRIDSKIQKLYLCPERLA